jgi:hypothetical protein
MRVGRGRRDRRKNNGSHKRERMRVSICHGGVELKGVLDQRCDAPAYVIEPGTGVG